MEKNKFNHELYEYPAWELPSKIANAFLWLIAMCIINLLNLIFIVCFGLMFQEWGYSFFSALPVMISTLLSGFIYNGVVAVIELDFDEDFMKREIEKTGMTRLDIMMLHRRKYVQSAFIHAMMSILLGSIVMGTHWHNTAQTGFPVFPFVIAIGILLGNFFHMAIDKQAVYFLHREVSRFRRIRSAETAHLQNILDDDTIEDDQQNYTDGEDTFILESES